MFLKVKDNEIISASTTEFLDLQEGESVKEFTGTDLINEDDVFNHIHDYKINETGEVIKFENLEYHRKLKDEELNAACAKSILSGFDQEINGVVYHFSFDTEAQLNFQGSERLLSSGMIESIDFTVFRDGKYERIAIDKDAMNILTMAILRHKADNIAKYRDVLMPKVEAASTKEEIESIKW